MTYLSYQRDATGQIKAVESPLIDAHSTFQPSGNVYTLEGIAIGFNVCVFGAPAPNGLVCFQALPMFTPGWDAAPPGDFGRVHVVDSAKGTVAIEWKL